MTVTTAIVHWNTVYLDWAIQQLRAEGTTVPVFCSVATQLHAGRMSSTPGQEPLPTPTKPSGFEVIFARRAHFILPDGTLDKPKWERIELHGTDIFGDD